MPGFDPTSLSSVELSNRARAERARALGDWLARLHRAGARLLRRRLRALAGAHRPAPGCC